MVLVTWLGIGVSYHGLWAGYCELPVIATAAESTTTCTGLEGANLRGR